MSSGDRLVVASTHQHQTSSRDDRLHFLVQDWLQRIRHRLPEAGTVVVTIHPLPQGDFLVAFRASVFEEAFISEAKERSVEAAAKQRPHACMSGSHSIHRKRKMDSQRESEVYFTRRNNP